MPNAPTLADAASPKAVLDGAGAWLADEIGQGFRWLKSRQAIERKVGTRLEGLQLQGSRYNRTGEFVRVAVIGVVRDDHLAAWRAAHPDEAVGNEGCLFFVQAGYVVGGAFEAGEFDLTRPAERPAVLDRMRAAAVEVLVPWLTSPNDPDAFIERGHLATLGIATPGLLDWLRCIDRADLAPVLLARVLEAHPRWRPGYERGASSPTRPNGSDSAALTGWVAKQMGISEA